MNRRTFLTSVSFFFLNSSLLAQENFLSVTQQTLADLRERQKAGQMTPAAWVADRLKALPPEQRLIAAFEVVQSIPYRLTHWTGDPDSLFSLGQGDCRHKAYGQIRLFKMLGFQAKHIKTRFDWADLPIPQPILANLDNTLGVHDSVAIPSNGKWIIADATWDPSLIPLGFPVARNWDGYRSTPPITSGKLTSMFYDPPPEGTNPYELLSVPWPDRAQTKAFNKAFNDWLDSFAEEEGIENRSSLTPRYDDATNALKLRSSR